MALNLSTFRTRTLSAIVFVSVMGVGLLWNVWSFFVLFGIVHFGCWLEYEKLLARMRPGDPAIPTCWKLGFPLAGWAGMWMALPAIDVIRPAVAIAVASAGLLMILAPAPLYFGRPRGLSQFLRLSAGLLYVSVPWALLMLIRGWESNPGSPWGMTFWGPRGLPCILVGAIWINDTMAYIVGSFIGRTPFSAVSPKKTWEGTLGGAVLCVGVMTGLGFWTKLYPPSTWIYLSAMAAVFGTAGDLLESKLKRMAGVKDSGRILPGHGGFLDRFDSLLVAIPASFLAGLLWAWLAGWSPQFP